MTEPERPTQFDDAAYCGWLLGTLADPGDRAALRRADLPAAAYQADRLLARWCSSWPGLREPLYLHAAAAARYDRVTQRSGVRIGRLAHQLASGRPPQLQPASVETRLLIVQRKPLDQAARVLGGLLAAAHNAGGRHLDWYALWRTYRYWDAQPDQYPTRRRLLTDYYAPPAHPTTPETSS